MRNRSTARLWSGSWPGCWLGLALLAVPLSRPAAADQPTLPEAPTEAPTDAPPGAPASAPSDVPADAPPAPAARTETPAAHHLAIIDVPPTPEQAAAATFLVPAARAAIQADGRFVVATSEQVAAARAEHGVSAMDLTYPDACRVGRAVGASHVILLGGYDLTLHTSEKKSDIKRALGMVSETGGGHGSAHSAPASRFEIEARATASIIVMDMASCKVGEQAVIRARRESNVSEQDARDRLRDDFDKAVRQGLQKLFPLQSFVRTPRDQGGGVIGHGSRHGMRHGQYYDVHRAGHVVGQVHVDQVEPDSAQVSLVRGAQRLQPGDRLTERDPVRVLEVALAATPNLLVRREAGEAGDALGVAAGVHVVVSEPVSGNIYGLMVEYLTMDELQRWRTGVHYAWQLRIVPRRLFAHARIGVGLFWANQPYIDETGQMDGATTRGIEILDGLGIKALLGQSLAVQAEISYPLALRDDQWFRASNSKHRAPADALLYPRPQRGLPTLSVALGWRF